MLPFSRFTDYMKLMLLAMTVATVTLMNQRQVAVMQHVPVSSQQKANQFSEEESQRESVVYQKVCFEATPGFAVPLPDIDLADLLPLAFRQTVFAAAEHFLSLTGAVNGIPAAVAGLLGTAILTRAP